jgi:hypothetical protein
MSHEHLVAPTHEQWQAEVNAAIVAGSLRWSHQFATTWSLDGDCPHCHHPQFSQVCDMKIWRGPLQTDTATFAPDETGPVSTAGPLVELEVACVGDGCGTSHGAAGTPCGAGIGLPITCLVPPAALDSAQEG